MANKKHFCPYPFMQIVARSGSRAGPCCNITDFKLNKDEPLESIWNSPEWNNLRREMISGDQPISRCQSCIKEEKKFNSSMRTTALRDYKFFSSEHYDKLLDHYNWTNLQFPERVEFHVGNLCNLKCLTCQPADSSAFLAENQVLGIESKQQSDFNINKKHLASVIENLHNGHIKLLDLRGGESLLVPEIKESLISLPEKIYQSVTLRVQTNGTILSADWKKIFQRFTQVDVMLSIDGFNHYNDYIRFPSSWKDIVENLNWMQSQTNIRMHVNCTVSNLNIIALDLLLDWCQTKNIYCHLAILRTPEIFVFDNLPASILKQSQEKLEKYKDLYPKLSAMISSTARTDARLWKKFCDTIMIRDRHRGNDILKIYPELAQYFYSYPTKLI